MASCSLFANILTWEFGISSAQKESNATSKYIQFQDTDQNAALCVCNKCDVRRNLVVV